MSNSIKKLTSKDFENLTNSQVFTMLHPDGFGVELGSGARYEDEYLEMNEYGIIGGEAALQDIFWGYKIKTSEYMETEDFSNIDWEECLSWVRDLETGNILWEK
jgi:hypothetical protein